MIGILKPEKMELLLKGCLISYITAVFAVIWLNPTTVFTHL